MNLIGVSIAEVMRNRGAMDNDETAERTPADAARTAEFEAVRRAISEWVTADPEVQATLLVGSWARGEARMDSDIDVVVVTESDRFVTSGDWIAPVCGNGSSLVRTGDWGALVERRVRLASGVEIEFGFVDPSWAATEPVDPGTHRVVSDGCLVWHDPSGLLVHLIETVNASI